MADYRNTTGIGTQTGSRATSTDSIRSGSTTDTDTTTTSSGSTSGPTVIVDGVTSGTDPVRGATHTVTVTVSKPFFADPGSVELTMTVDGQPVDDKVFIYSVLPEGSGSVNVTYDVPDKDSYTIGFEEVSFSKTFQTVSDPSDDESSTVPDFDGGNGGSGPDGGTGGGGIGSITDRIGTKEAAIIGGGALAAIALASSR
jgi:hypothetical protein